MKQLSKHHQVICITHLPQIASLGDHHFRISKKVEKEMTCATIDRLDGEGRVTEIARMLGGIDISEKTLDHAREMLTAVI
jgi:DNA repair protein RecN (Recombination protein N)